MNLKIDQMAQSNNLCRISVGLIFLLTLIQPFIKIQAQTFTYPVSIVNYAMKINHEGNLIVEGNEVFEINNCIYTQIDGSITLRDKAILRISDSKLVLNNTSPSNIYPPLLKMNISVYNNAKIEIHNSIVEGIGHGFPLILYNESIGILNNVSIFLMYFIINDNSKFEYIDVVYSEYTNLKCGDNSQVIMKNSHARSIYQYGNSKIMMENSTGGLSITENSTATIIESKIGLNLGNFWMWDGKYENFTNQIANVDILKTEISCVWLNFRMFSNVTLNDLPTGNIKYWNLYENNNVFNSYINLTIRHSEITGSWNIRSFENSTITIENMILRGDKCAVRYETLTCYGFSQIYLINSTVEGLHLYDHSIIWLINSYITHVIKYNEFSYPLSLGFDATINVAWYLNVLVTTDSHYLSGINVYVYDSNNELIKKGITNKEGRISFILPEYLIKGISETLYFGNYTILIEYFSEIFKENIILDKNKNIEIIIPFKYINYSSVNITLYTKNIRIDAGRSINYTWKGYLVPNGIEFKGNIILNDTVLKNDIGKYNFKVYNISGIVPTISNFTSNSISCIWDRVKIVGGGVSQESTFVKNSETVWFKAEYEYDSEIFDGSKGTLYVNSEPLEWSSVNSRWEKEVTSDSPTTKTFEVTGIQDDKYGLTTFNDVVGSLSIQWKQQGIPGFQYESIIIGVLIGTLLLWWMRRQS